MNVISTYIGEGEQFKEFGENIDKAPPSEENTVETRYCPVHGTVQSYMANDPWHHVYGYPYSSNAARIIMETAPKPAAC